MKHTRLLLVLAMLVMAGIAQAASNKPTVLSEVCQKIINISCVQL